MKQTLLLVFSVVSFFANAQNMDSTTFQYTEVVKVDSASKNALYISARKFMISAFKNSKSVIDLDDKEAGTIVGKGVMYAQGTLLIAYREVPIRFQISIECREGRYKYSFTDYIVGRELEGREFPIEQKPKRISQGMYDKMKIQVVAQTQALIKDMKKIMSTKENDW